MKVKCFTHSDLDGVVSNLLFCKYYTLIGYGHSTENCNTGDDVDKKIKAYLNNAYEYTPEDIIVITDVCMSYDVACILDNLPNRKILIDHHDTSKDMLSRKNKESKETDFNWAFIQEGDSATMLVYKYLHKLTKESIEINNILKEYRTLTLVTDLWDTKPRDSIDFLNWLSPIENTLSFMNCIGFANFKARFMSNPSIELSDVEMAKVETVKKIKDNVMKYTNVFVRPYTYKDTKICYGVCFGGLYRSEIAEYVFQNNSDLTFLIVIDMNNTKVSFRRARHALSENMNLIQIAKQFDEKGGGHPFACGFNFKLEEYNKIIDALMYGDFILD